MTTVQGVRTGSITTSRVASRDAVSWNSREWWGDDDSASPRPRRASMVETFGPTDDEWAVFTSHGNWHGVRQGAQGPQGARGCANVEIISRR